MITRNSWKAFATLPSYRALAALEAYASWLAHNGYSEVQRIDLESGGYQAGLEVGNEWKGWPAK